MNKIFLYSRRFDSPGREVVMKDYVHRADVVEPNQALLDMIFGVNPTSGLPEGDLSVFLGDKANPEVKMFIQSQLMNERSAGQSAMDFPNDVRNKFRELSDDDIALFSRNHDESREEYADRLRLFFANERVKRTEDAKNREFEELKKKIQGS